jgi:uncharacterized protein YaaN involved in tellurite resistance
MNETTAIVPAAEGGGEIQALQSLAPAERQAAEELARALDVRDPLAVSHFGVRPQREMSEMADALLRIVNPKDAGPAGEALTDLLGQVKALDTGSLANQVEAWLKCAPGVDRACSKIQQFRARNEKVAAKIERITVALEKARSGLNRDVAVLEQYYEQNRAGLRGLLLHVAAGELKLEALRAEHAEQAAAASASRDPLRMQEVADLADAITRLERRVHDLRLAVMVSLQTAPQIRMIQNSNRALADKIQSSILITIPLWKGQVLLAIALAEQAKASGLQRGVADATKAILEGNARALRTGTMDVAREVERGFVDIETLRTVNGELIHTIEDSLQIQEEGHRQREEAEGEITRMQAELRRALASARTGRLR